MTVPTRWQDVKCRICAKAILDPKDAIIANDVSTGGLQGAHKLCLDPNYKPEGQP